MAVEQRVEVSSTVVETPIKPASKGEALIDLVVAKIKPLSGVKVTSATSAK